MAEESNIQNGKSIFFDDPWQYYNAMLEDIEGARKSIYVETYKFGSGNIGERFRDVLTQKAEEGVKVKVLLRVMNRARHVEVSRSTLKTILNRNCLKTMFFHPSVK